MLESLADRLHEPGGPHYGAPDKTASPPAGDARSRGPGPHPVHHRHPRRLRRDAARSASTPCSRSASRARAPRPRAGGHRAELPAQAGHEDARRTSPVRPEALLQTIAIGAAGARRCDAHPGAAQPHRPEGLGDLVAGGHRRLGWSVAADRGPREPGAAVARARPAAGRDRSRRQDARTPADRLPRVRPRSRPVARSRRAVPGAVRQRPRRSRPRRRLGQRRRSRTPHRPPAAHPGSRRRTRRGRAGRRAQRRGDRRRRDRHVARRARP